MTTQINTDLKQRLPIPPGIAFGSYFRDMREVAAYDVLNDAMCVRYDWLDPDGKQMHFMADPLSAHEFLNINKTLELRRFEVLQHRGINL